jgi:predicted metal-dependent hydrolase
LTFFQQELILALLTIEQESIMQENIPTPRTVKPNFAVVPRHWLANNAVATHIANGVNVLFPEGERFFVRSVHRYASKIEDPILQKQMKGFFGQEGKHAGTHEDFNKTLEQQGFQLKNFLRFYRFLAFGVIERLSPPQLRLAITAASEHFTAILAEVALRDSVIKNHGHPVMKQLLLWHAAEEIEHKAVAFDVLQKINPSYALRMWGLAVATLCLGGFWTIATLTLLRQDKKLGAPSADAIPLQRLRRQEDILRRTFVGGLRQYIKRDFHPNQNDNLWLAQQYLAQAGLTNDRL